MTSYERGAALSLLFSHLSPVKSGEGRPPGRLNRRRLAFGVCVRAGGRPPLVLQFRFVGCVCLLCVCFVRWSKTFL